ncbi:MAG: alpha/beta hydrolase [Desulfuromonas sp.]|nr:MAG: alpha/beta hydrolase [Desulfuromonas sp.]
MLAFSEKGNGPAVLLIHGFPLNRRMWQPQLEALAGAGYRVIAPDLPGFGASPPLTGPVTMRHYAAALVALLEQLEIDQAVVCGMSMGGYVLLSMLEHFPARVAAAGFIVTRAAADDAAGKVKRSELAVTARSQGAEPVADIFAELVFAPQTLQQRPELVETVRGWMLSCNPEGAAGALEAMRERPDYVERLGEIGHPALVVGAAQDRAIPLGESQLLAAGLSQGELVTIENAGHMVNLEQPDIFNHALIDFLQRCVKV